MCVILPACFQAGEFGLEPVQKKDAWENREEKMRNHGKTENKRPEKR